MGHVRPLVTLDNKKEIEHFAQEILDRGLNVREAERLINQKDEPKVIQPKEKRSDYVYAESLFEKKLQTRIEINNKKITISFEDDDDLNRILETLDLIE